MNVLRAQQALAILAALETLPAGSSVRVYHSPSQGWTAMYGGRVHFGDSPTDALGQLTCCLSLEASEVA